MAKTDSAPLYGVHGEIPFPCRRAAEIVFDVLRVDEEPPRSQVKKLVNIQDSTLIVDFKSTIPKQLRVAVDLFFDRVALVSETLLAFGPAVSDGYSYSDGTTQEQ